ncbi:MAG: DRTGG domain-containing protein [Candidatus Hydrogenedentes bacterium]|nr:DRTGG domain-containing protein [Candidatus Hydrogenedentota bacterium]
MGITLSQIAEKLGAQIIEGKRGGKRQINRVYAGDRVSDLLNQASDTTLIVTNLANSSVVRLIELMDVPGICLLNGVQPGPELVQAAKDHDAPIIISTGDMFQTCAKLHQIMETERAPQTI